MNSFLAGTDVTLSIPLVDDSGNPLSVASIQYGVTDQTGAVVLPAAPLDSFTAGDDHAAVLVPAASNTLGAGFARAMRNIALDCLTDDGNTVRLSGAYTIEFGDALTVGVNSFQNYAQAEFTALSVPNIPGWDAASKAQRVAALIEARMRLCQLNYSQLNTNVIWGQDSLNFMPEGPYATGIISLNGLFLFNGNLTLLQPDQFAKLPQRFLDMLYLAQVVEADEILGGDPMGEKRRDGLVQDAVGESRQVFRAGKPLNLPCSRRALAYVSYFVTFAKHVGRG